MKTAGFGLHLTDFADPAWAGTQLMPRLTAVCEALEECEAFDTVWLNDHLHHQGPEGPSATRPETMMLLAAAAVPTSTLRLGLLVASATFRHPALLVKMVTTLDVLSGGRAILGIGAGHPRTEIEHRTYGLPFPPLGERLDLLETALALIHAMLRGGGPPNAPPPIGPLPIMVGGSGERRLLRLVARYADMCNFSAPAGDGPTTLPHKLEVLERHCEAVGRDRSEITVTYKTLMVIAASETDALRTWDAYRTARGLPPGLQALVGTPEQAAEKVAHLMAIGVDEVIVEVPNAHDPEVLYLASGALGMAVAAADLIS
jgi:alkanesulfonate monooxygenase SsuD/methylene tetrahydromethanopterin reductase-like flavin-dependent oxidoreductase (luciferase family)